MLNGRAILVVEDQAIIGMALAAAIRNAGGIVVGPAASAKSALDLIDTSDVAAAVLDVTLADGTVAPVIEQLVERGLPFIVQSGVGVPRELEMRFPDMIVLIKPTTASVVVDRLAALIGGDPHDANDLTNLPIASRR